MTEFERWNHVAYLALRIWVLRLQILWLKIPRYQIIWNKDRKP